MVKEQCARCAREGGAMQAVLEIRRGVNWEREMLGVLSGLRYVSGRQVRSLERLARVFRVMGVPEPLCAPVQGADGVVWFKWAAAGGRVSNLAVRVDGGRYYSVARGEEYRNHVRAAGGNGPVERKLCAALRVQLEAQRVRRGEGQKFTTEAQRHRGGA